MEIYPKIREIVENNNMKVLREIGTNRPLNVSYSEEGLKLTINKAGRLLCYRNAILRNRDGVVAPEGDMRPSNRVYIEDFKPRDFNDSYMSKLEARWIDKAFRMCC